MFKFLYIMSYKIKIYTSNNKNDQLQYNDLTIDEKTIIPNKLLNDNITSIILLKKTLIINKYKKIHTNSLEFFYNKEISEDEFKLFIKNMKNNNLKAICKKTTIKFINTITNDIIYNYIFDNIIKIENKNNEKRKENRSFYKTYQLF